MIDMVKLKRVSVLAGVALSFAFAPAARAVTTAQYAQLSEMVYCLSGDPDMSNLTAPPGFTRLTTSTDEKSGFKAAAYEETATKAVVVSYAGTDNLHDVLADLGIAEKQIGAYEDEAEKAAERRLEKWDSKLTKEMAKAGSVTIKPNADLLRQIKLADAFYDDVAVKYAGRTITITGHSLGGYLGQLVASRTGSYTVLFNGPGGADMSRGKSSNIVNYVRKYDVVGNVGRHIGKLGTYIEVKLHMLDVKTRYVVRNHSIVGIRKDIESGMTPLE
jgi:hypothetical protein